MKNYNNKTTNQSKPKFTKLTPVDNAILQTLDGIAYKIDSNILNYDSSFEFSKSFNNLVLSQNAKTQIEKTFIVRKKSILSKNPEEKISNKNIMFNVIFDYYHDLFNGIPFSEVLNKYLINRQYVPNVFQNTFELLQLNPKVLINVDPTLELPAPEPDLSSYYNNEPNVSLKPTENEIIPDLDLSAYYEEQKPEPTISSPIKPELEPAKKIAPTKPKPTPKPKVVPVKKVVSAKPKPTPKPKVIPTKPKPKPTLKPTPKIEFLPATPSNVMLTTIVFGTLNPNLNVYKKVENEINAKLSNIDFKNEFMSLPTIQESLVSKLPSIVKKPEVKKVLIKKSISHNNIESNSLQNDNSSEEKTKKVKASISSTETAPLIVKKIVNNKAVSTKTKKANNPKVVEIKNEVNNKTLKTIVKPNNVEPQTIKKVSISAEEKARIAKQKAKLAVAQATIAQIKAEKIKEKELKQELVEKTQNKNDYFQEDLKNLLAIRKKNLENSTPSSKTSSTNLEQKIIDSPKTSSNLKKETTLKVLSSDQLKKEQKLEIIKKVIQSSEKQLISPKNTATKDSNKNTILNKKKPVVLIIRDGWGEAKASKWNAITSAKTPISSFLTKNYPNILMHADGEYVGLPKGQMGNSEVGHLNIGAGRIVYQSLSLINNAIKTGEFSKNKILLNAFENTTKNKSNLHVFGLLSDGGVHSHINHLKEIQKTALAKGLKNIYFHFFLDGRDVQPKSATIFIKEMQKLNINIASISGRYYSMDRDKKWDREMLVYDVMVSNKGKSFVDPINYINSEYKEGRSDEFIMPSFNSKLNIKIQDNDSVIFANFRPDRARQLSHLFVKTKIPGYDFSPKPVLKNLFFCTMMKYDGVEVPVLFEHQKLNNLVGDVFEKNNLTQMRAAETEKYPHVTFFFDGGVDLKRKNEIRILAQSPKVATYDLKPEMSAVELTDSILKQIEKVDVAIINYANTDMVGHSGKVGPTIKAAETVDSQIGRLYDKVTKELGGTLIVTADHGNAEKMLDDDGKTPYTAHTTNLVEFIIVSKNVHFLPKFVNKNVAKLGDIGPTMLKLLGIEKPKEMEGEVLIK